MSYRLDARVSQEASAMGALYRDALLFPDPPRTRLTTEVRGLTYQTMTIMWQRQRHGWIPRAKNPYLDGITHSLFTFKPRNLGESDLQLVAENDFQKAYELRRERFHSVSAGVPTSLYAVAFFGAGLVIFSHLFPDARKRAASRRDDVHNRGHDWARCVSDRRHGSSIPW
jgi:hypothetical protein